MNRHYQFVEFKDDKIAYFKKKMVCSSLIRAVICFLLTTLYLIIGKNYRLFPLKTLTTLATSITSTSFQQVIYDIAFLLLLLSFLRELAMFIHSLYITKEDVLESAVAAGRFSIVLTDGILIQSEDITIDDINHAKKCLANLQDKYTDQNSYVLFSKLHKELNSSSERTATDAAIYIEILQDQLSKGNQKILTSIKDFYQQ